MTSANSSWGVTRHSLVPSQRITSSTYSRFLPTATFSYGFDTLATSNTFENTYAFGSSSMTITRPFS